MAGAALVAFTLWRKQIAGETHHDLAKRLATTVIDAGTNANGAMSMWRRVAEESWEPTTLKRPFKNLSASIDELRKLELEAEAYWGRRYSKPIADLAFWCSVLNNAIEELSERRPATFYRIGMNIFDGGKPDSTGARNIHSLAALLDDWLGHQVGRPNALPFTQEEFDRRVKETQGTTQHEGWRDAHAPSISNPRLA